jgi:DNA topoisomerase-1
MARPEACSNYVRVGKKEWQLKGKAVSDEQAGSLNKMGLPPGWNNVVVSTDLSAKVQAVGQDAAGRWQYRYAEAHIEAAKKKKFVRQALFDSDMPTIRAKYEADVLANDASAMLLRIEDQTAVRIGSDTDFKARVKAYGLTTLQTEHITIKGNKVILDFIAKEGIPAHYEINDSVVAKWLKARLQGKKVGEQVFADVKAKKLNDYLKEIAGGKNYTVKDFRTYHASKMAYTELIKFAGMDLTAKERKIIIKEVSEKISKFLRNTPVMARNSYINPVVWDIIGGLI